MWSSRGADFAAGRVASACPQMAEISYTYTFLYMYNIRYMTCSARCARTNDGKFAMYKMAWVLIFFFSFLYLSALTNYMYAPYLYMIHYYYYVPRALYVYNINILYLRYGCTLPVYRTSESVKRPFKGLVDNLSTSHVMRAEYTLRRIRRKTMQIAIILYVTTDGRKAMYLIYYST